MALTWIFAGWLFTVPVYAQDDSTETPATGQPATATGDDSTAPTAEQPTPTADATARATDDSGLTLPPSDEDFVPSVRITEDLPVAFPVDI